MSFFFDCASFVWKSKNMRKIQKVYIFIHFSTFTIILWFLRKYANYIYLYIILVSFVVVFDMVSRFERCRIVLLNVQHVVAIERDINGKMESMTFEHEASSVEDMECPLLDMSADWGQIVVRNPPSTEAVRALLSKRLCFVTFFCLRICDSIFA